MIYVCSMAKVADTVASSGAGRLVTLLSKDTPFERPASIAAGNHLLLSMHDILEDQAEMVAPAQVHVETLLEFVRSWDRRKPILIHCFAGISRSTAAAHASSRLNEHGC